MDAIAQLLALIVFIYIMFLTMKYVFKLLFGAAFINALSKNIFLQVLARPLRYLFNRKEKPKMMNRFEAGKFLNGMNRGLVIDGQDKRLSEKDSFNHMAVIARSGGGKTTSYIVPNILKLASSKNSMIVTDLSGELYEQTSGYMHKKGFKVYALDPEDLNSSIGYNPLYYALTSVEIDEVAEILIRSANPGQIKPEDKIWIDGAKNFLAILIKVLVGTKDYRYINLANLKYLLNNYNASYPDPETGTKNYKLDDLVYKYCDDRTFDEWRGFMGSNEKTLQSFLATANTALNAIGINENLALLTANHSINFENFRKEKTILYIKVPQHKQELYSFLLNLFYKQFFNAMMNRLPSKNDLAVFCLLDEFGNMAIPHFSSTVTTIRKYKVSISIVIQSLKQLETKYGRDDAHTIMTGGITGKLYYSGADYEMSEMLSRSIGTQYVNRVDEYGRVHYFKEPVLSADEIRTMGDNEVLFIYGNKLPLKMNVKPYFKDFVLKSYTSIAPVYNEGHLEQKSIEYIDLDVEIDYA